MFLMRCSIIRKDGAEPSLKNMMLGKRVVGDMLLERIPLDSIPRDPDEASEWLHKNYRHKVFQFSITALFFN